jgi:hypothetical protein
MSLSLIRAHECRSIKGAFERILRWMDGIKKADKKSRDMELDEIVELMDMIKDSKIAWKTSVANFDYMVERQLIDYYSYQIKANELRFEYLLRKAKEKGIKAKFFEGL